MVAIFSKDIGEEIGGVTDASEEASPSITGSRGEGAEGLEVDGGWRGMAVLETSTTATEVIVVAAVVVVVAAVVFSETTSGTDGATDPPLYGGWEGGLKVGSFAVLQTLG